MTRRAGPRVEGYGVPSGRRRSSRSLRAAALAGCFIVIGSLPVSAGPAFPAHFLAPSAGSSLQPGETVTVRWSALPPETREFELLLITGDGKTAPIRLTVRMEPDLRTFRWTVPRLPCASARLELRLSRGHGEEIAAVGEPFEIALAKNITSLTSLVFRGGEWWVAGGHVSSAPRPHPDRTTVTAAAGLPWPLEPLELQSEWTLSLSEPAPRQAGLVPGFGDPSLEETTANPRRRPLSIPQRE